MTAVQAIRPLDARGQSQGNAEFDLDRFVTRYVAMWNEPDPAARRDLVEALWMPDGVNFTRSMEVRGHAALERRVRDSYEKWVRDGGCFFRPSSVHALAADGHHGALRLHWDMLSVSGGGVLSLGLEILLLSDDGRIRQDYQFILA
jgi:hypothetical protein